MGSERDAQAKENTTNKKRSLLVKILQLKKEYAGSGERKRESESKMVKEAVKDLLEVRISELTVSAVKINTAA